ncbi:MAG TPA: class I SAM-dependent methyltransferase [Verrucomicrobiae bacterium]|nr:class I SAM-dependent methyltransferase [Verrucomicrobiae bacterium]
MQTACDRNKAPEDWRSPRRFARTGTRGRAGVLDYNSQNTVALWGAAPYSGWRLVSESKYIEKKGYLSPYTHARMVALHEAATRRSAGSAQEAEWLRAVQEDLPRFIPFLVRKCGLEFRGRVLEIGAGGGWLSAEISKLPKVVEVITTDFSAVILKEQAPKVFQLLNARNAKITRMPGDFHRFDFPNNHFDFVVCSAVLHDAVNIVQVLREAKRILKPGGQFVAIREPVWPLVKIKSRSRMVAKLVATGVNERFYTLSDYQEFFRQAALPLEVKRVNLSRGFKYYVNKVLNGLTHARYAFIGVKRGTGQSSANLRSQAGPDGLQIAARIPRGESLQRKG